MTTFAVIILLGLLSFIYFSTHFGRVLYKSRKSYHTIMVALKQEFAPTYQRLERPFSTKEIVKKAIDRIRG